MSKQTIEIPVKLVVEVDFIAPKTDKTELVENIHTAAKKALNAYSWAEIAEISKSGKAQDYFFLYDTKSEKLKNGEIVTFVIIGFNHDKIHDSNEFAGITFGVKELLKEFAQMNSDWTNVGGWEKCKMREYLKSIYESQLPAALKKAIVTVDKLTSLGGENSKIGTTADTLFLLSEIEVQGTVEYSVKGEGKQYPYFAEKHCKNKYRNEDNYSDWWWLRSPNVGNATSFCNVNSTGTATPDTASGARGVSFCFCI